MHYHSSFQHPSAPGASSGGPVHPDHQQQTELFRIIETAETRLREFRMDPGAPAAEIHHWRKTADQAREKIILGNQGLVVSIVRKYENQGMDREELIQEGNIGLMTAVGKYDYRRGNRLSTYAVHWIRQAVCRALSNQSRTVRIPSNQLDMVRKVAKVKNQLMQESGFEPSAWEIAEILDLPVRRVKELLELDAGCVSLDAPAGDADAPPLLDRMADRHAPDPSWQTDSGQCLDIIRKALDRLDERERQVLELRYGCDGGRRHTLEEIGSIVGVTRERVRQIQKNAEDRMIRYRKSLELDGLARIHKSSGAAKRRDGSAPHRRVTAAPAASAGTAGGGSTCLRMRSVQANENHHIWNNNGIWFCNFIVRSGTNPRKRVRVSLGTRNVVEARILRDEKIRSLGGAGLLPDA